MMDQKIRLLLSPLDDEVVGLFYRWTIFHQLFGSGEENLKLLNRSGSNIFALLQALLVDNFYLTLSRLTDPDATGKHENLSLSYFLRAIDSLLSAQARTELQASLATLSTMTENIRSHRNKRIGHLDLKHAIRAKELPSVVYNDINAAIELVRKIMQGILLELENASGYGEPCIEYGCDGTHLLTVLRDAHRSTKKSEGGLEE